MIYEQLHGAGFESIGDVAIASSEELMREADIGNGAVRRRLIAKANEVRDIYGMKTYTEDDDVNGCTHAHV